MYRGIAVSSQNADEVIATIKSRGLPGDEGTQWRSTMPSVRKIRDRLDFLYEKSDLSKDDIYQDAERLGVDAAGSSIGGEYYAAKHNRSWEDDQPIVIVFDVDVDKVAVDCRDFLCTVFQLWDRAPEDWWSFQDAVMTDVFGSGILRYFGSAREANEQQRRIAMCNLACFDLDVVVAHHANRKVIAGRYGTVFTSAFSVEAPVESESIRDVYAVSAFHQPTVDVSLDDMWGPRQST